MAAIDKFKECQAGRKRFGARAELSLGLLNWLLRKDALRLRGGRRAGSYGIVRQPPAPAGETMRDQSRGPTVPGDRQMAFLLEFWRFLRVRKKYWLLPVLLMMVMFGGLIVLTQGSAVAPFIYTLF
jgi:hypothetical protein